MRETFEHETEYICRRIAMCEKFKEGKCKNGVSPEECLRALKAVAKLNSRLVFGNNPKDRMLYEDIRVCHDMCPYLK